MVRAYAVCVFVIGHTGMHRISRFEALRIPYDPSRRRAVNAGMMTMASLGTVAVGLAATKEVVNWTSLAEMPNENSENNRTVAESASEQSASSSTSFNDRKRSQSNTERSPRNNVQGELGSGLQNENPLTSQRNDDSSQSNNEPFGNSTNDSPENASPDNLSNNDFVNTSSTICTRCHKRCRLSASKCNKSYAAGLI